VPADSAVELPYRKSRSGLVAAIVVSVIIGGIVAIIAASSGKPTGIKLASGDPGGAELAALSIAKTPTALAESLSTTASDRTVYANLDSDKFGQVNFSYQEGHLDHPSSFYFVAKQGAEFQPAVRAALEAKLHTVLDEHGGWRWERVWLNVDQATGAMGGNVETETSDKEPNPLWKRQLDVLFQIVVAATFNQDVGPSEAEAKELLGTGYSFRTLASLDPRTPVESARERVEALFPGSVSMMRGNLEIHVALDHPMFTHAEIEWKNEHGAPVYELAFRPRLGPNGYAARRDAVVACLGKDLGKPEVRVTDYLKGAKDYYFTPKHARVYVSDAYLYSLADAPDQALWTKIIESLDGCR